MQVDPRILLGDQGHANKVLDAPKGDVELERLLMDEGGHRVLIEQPVRVEQALIDHVLVAVTFVLDDHWAAVLIPPQRIDAAVVLGANPLKAL